MLYKRLCVLTVVSDEHRYGVVIATLTGQVQRCEPSLEEYRGQRSKFTSLTTIVIACTVLDVAQR